MAVPPVKVRIAPAQNPAFDFVKGVEAHGETRAASVWRGKKALVVPGRGAATPATHRGWVGGDIAPCAGGRTG